MATKVATAQIVRKQFEEAAFVVTELSPGKIELKKSGCAAYLENRSGKLIYSGTPYLVVHGINCELEDQGYQKFWYSKPEGKRFPIRKVELETLHRFDEEVRYISGNDRPVQRGAGIHQRPNRIRPAYRAPGPLAAISLQPLTLPYADSTFHQN